MRADGVIKVLSDLKTRLTAAGVTAYNELADSGATFPYVVYDTDNSDSDGAATEILRLDIDGWDDFGRTGSTLELETMMASVVTALEQVYVLPEAGISIRYVLDQRMNLQDEDKQIRRRKYTFDVRIIGRKET